MKFPRELILASIQRWDIFCKIKGDKGKFSIGWGKSCLATIHWIPVFAGMTTAYSQSPLYPGPPVRHIEFPVQRHWLCRPADGISSINRKLPIGAEPGWGRYWLRQAQMFGQAFSILLLNSSSVASRAGTPYLCRSNKNRTRSAPADIAACPEASLFISNNLAARAVQASPQNAQGFPVRREG